MSSWRTRQKALITSLTLAAEAVEAALKLARQYFVERGQPQRRFLIALRQS
jgi:acetylornithine/succinyldiaminopimelate/putrescine aminotransferase